MKRKHCAQFHVAVQEHSHVCVYAHVLMCISEVKGGLYSYTVDALQSPNTTVHKCRPYTLSPLVDFSPM